MSGENGARNGRSASGWVTRMISTARADDHEGEQGPDVHELGEDAQGQERAPGSRR